MAKKQKKGLPPWMGTFADLATLLLTFFVLLLTFANMDIQKFHDMLGSVQKAFGVQVKVRGQYQATKPLVAANALKAQAPAAPTMAGMTRPSAVPTSSSEARAAAENAAQAREVRQMANQAGLGQSVEITSGPRGVRMRVKGQLLFLPGQAQVRPEARRLLEAVAKVMRKFHYYLTVEGHTDSTPIHTPQFPSNWELSASRASAVLRFLLSLGVPQRKVSAVGYAANYPLASNATQEGRNKNRRVEFVFTKKPLRSATQ